jgi:hypothetical protein
MVWAKALVANRLTKPRLAVLKRTTCAKAILQIALMHKIGLAVSSNLRLNTSPHEAARPYQ